MPSALELVEAALADVAGPGTGAWKQALFALEPLEPDAAAAAAVIAAYEGGRCPPWCAAALLGAIGHADGYATALAILRAAPGQLAESYAGPALVRMRGEAALADLAAVVEDDTLDRRAHEGAAFGLARIADGRADELLVAAVARERVRTSVAGSVACDRGVADDVLIGWLRGTSTRLRNTAAWAVFYLAAKGRVSAVLEAAMRVALDGAALPFTAAQREMLRDRLAPTN